MSAGNWRPPEPDPFVELTDDERLREAIEARAAGRDRRERAAEVATWEGSLHDIAERQATVVIRVPGDRAHRGTLLAVGIDHLALQISSGAVVLIATDTVRSVRPEAGTAMPVATGDRERSQDRTLVEVLEQLRELGDEVVLGLRDSADQLTGTVRGLGEDVVTLRVARGRAGTVYLPIAAIAEVVITG